MISGSHQLLFPRLMSSNVFDGAANVFATRCHCVNPAPCWRRFRHRLNSHIAHDFAFQNKISEFPHNR